MKRSVYIFLLLIISILPAFSQKIQIDSPIYLAARLIDEPDTTAMSKFCKSYNLSGQPREDGYTVFTTPNGERIRFKTEDQSTVVEITTKDKSSSIDKILTQVGFKKSKDTYERGSKFSPRKTTCTISSSPTTLHFIKTHNSTH